MKISRSRIFFSALAIALFLSNAMAQRPRPASRQPSGIATSILLQIMRAEDHRRWDENLEALLSHANAKVRKRAALAAGRIGDERAVVRLSERVLMDRDADVRQMAAFALGEIEAAGGAYSLIQVLKDPNKSGDARAVEALGKITAAFAAATPPPGHGSAARTEDSRLDVFRAAILDTLRIEEGQTARRDEQTILLALTAVLRTRPDGAGPVVRNYLGHANPRIVADALNTLTRLRLKDGNDQARVLLVKHTDPIVRANAARVLGATEEKQAFDGLLDRALHDYDARVGASAIRALGSLKDMRAVLPLSRRATELLRAADLTRGGGRNEALEILSALGQILGGTQPEETGERAAALMRLALTVRAMTHENILEDEVARARQDPDRYVSYLDGFESAAALPKAGLSETFYGWRSISARAAGLGELGRLKPAPPAKTLEAAQVKLRRMLDDRRTPTLAVPNILNSYAVFKPKNLSELLPRYLAHSDVIVRSSAAELLGDQPPSEANTRALVEALPRAMRDKDLNDAALAILDALGKQKSKKANDAIKTALDSSDHLIRRKAVALLKANGAGDFSNRIGYVQTRNTDADYRRAIARFGKRVTATVVTEKGSFTIEFLSEEAPLTVDNFIQLARKGFFNGQTIPRVVPNFVVQAGDPRGDQNGGPGYQIRCEINEVPYDRAAVGMALSGKDTGGSQWFVTHSPQPHLDGGYTVFGRVVSGMDVVDRIARGDKIRRVIVNER